MRDRLVQIILSPILIVQAVWVISRALRLPEASGPRSGISGQGPDVRVLIFGDSSAAGVGVNAQSDALCGQLVQALASHRRVIWHLEARSGDTTAGAYKRLKSLQPQAADIAVIALGVNDTTRLVPSALWHKKSSDLRQDLRDRFGVKYIYVSDIPPLEKFPLIPNPLSGVLGRHAARLSHCLAAAAAREHDTEVVTFDLPDDPNLMAKDGFHPSHLVYQNWAQELARRILSNPMI